MGESEFHFSPRPNRAHEIKWRGWSEEAFAEAGKLDRPILLSISAVWCHWCHVMDETTYSNPGVIDLINREYLPIRVDNDLRPDVNQRYNMGGWPTTAFLTSSGELLTGATYLPPDQMADAGSQDADEHYYSLDAAARARETAPYVDRRVYTSWNAALAISYLDAAIRCERPALREHAATMLERLFHDRYRPSAGLTHGEGVAGQLADQVWGLWAAVRAHQSRVTGDWLTIAGDIAEHLESTFADPVLGGYFDHAGTDQLGRLSERIKPLVENAIAAMALVELDQLVGDPEQPYLVRARRVLESVAALPRQYGLMAAVFARALDRTRHVS